MERIEKFFDGINQAVFGALVIAYFLGFIALLLAAGTIIHLFHHRVRYMGILAAIVWIMVVFS